MATLGRVLPGVQVSGVTTLGRVFPGVPGVYRCLSGHLRSCITWCTGGVQVSR